MQPQLQAGDGCGILLPRLPLGIGGIITEQGQDAEAGHIMMMRIGGAAKQPSFLDGQGRALMCTNEKAPGRKVFPEASLARPVFGGSPEFNYGNLYFGSIWNCEVLPILTTLPLPHSP